MQTEFNCRWGMRFFYLAMLILGTLSPTGCAKDPLEDTTLSEMPRWIYRDDKHADVALVFVHGLFGGATSTWTNEKGESLFQYIHDNPDIGPQVDIFAFGFTSNMLRDGSLDIREAAGVLDDRLRYAGVWDYDTVVFVTHSMGGLITMQELVNHPDRLEQVPLVMMYAVPQEGSQLAQIGAHFSDNPALRQLVPANGSDFLRGLDDSWGLIPRERLPHVVCAYETADTHGIKIVDRTSATRYCDGTRMAVGGTDHITIVKPTHEQHDSVVKLVIALNDYVLGTKRKPLVEAVGFTNEGEHLVYSYDLQKDNVARLVNQGPRTVRYTLGPMSNPKLIVSPTHTPRHISPGNTEELRFYLLHTGEWRPEYRLTLKAAAMPERTIVVRVSKEVINQNPTIEKLASDLEQHLEVPENIAQLKALSPDGQREWLIDAAQKSLQSQHPELSNQKGLSALITADALSATGFSELAAATLLKATDETATWGEVKKIPSAEPLISAIEKQTGVKLPGTWAHATDYGDVKISSYRPSHINLDTWSRLATKLQEVPALKPAGLSLKGDVFRERGMIEDAKIAYRDAHRISASPELEFKLRDIQHMQQTFGPNIQYNANKDMLNQKKDTLPLQRPDSEAEG